MRRSPLFLQPRLLPSTPSAAHNLSPRAITALFGRFTSTMRRVRLLVCSLTTCPRRFPPGSGVAEATADQMRSPKACPREGGGSDEFLLYVMRSSTTVEPRHLAYRRHWCCLRLCQRPRPPRYAFRAPDQVRGHPAQSLCTLRDGRHPRLRGGQALPPRNTHYQAPATAYLDRTSTGWNTPASWRTDRNTIPLFWSAHHRAAQTMRVWCSCQLIAHR